MTSLNLECWIQDKASDSDVLALQVYFIYVNVVTCMYIYF